MTFEVVTQPQAEFDIAEAFNYIAERAPQAAVRWYRRLKFEIEKLSESPKQFGLAPESQQLSIEIRQFHFGKRSGQYRVVFMIDEARKQVHVLTVRHSARKPLDPKDLA